MTGQVVSSQKSGSKLVWRRLLGVGLLTVGVAVVANLLVRALLFATVDLPADFPSLQAGPVGVFTVVGVSLAVVAFAIVARVAARPGRTYTIVAAIAFILSILPNLALAANPAAAPFPGGTATAFLTLITFHVVAALVSVLLLTRFALEKR